MLTPYKTLLFDIDDTLLDFQKAQKDAFKALCTDLSIPYQDDYYTLYDAINKHYWRQYEQNIIEKDVLLGARFTDFFQSIGVHVDGTLCDTTFRNYLTKGNQLFPDTLHVIEQLAQTHTLAIVTNGVKHTQLERLKNNNLLPYFENRLFISDDIGYKKPEKAFFDTVFQQLQCTKHDTIIIGDSLEADINGGHKFAPMFFTHTLWSKITVPISRWDKRSPLWTAI